MAHWRHPKVVNARSYGLRHQFHLEVGKYYRNNIGLPVFISGEIDQSSPFFVKGYRFVDHRGSFYRPDGFVSGWPWRGLNIKREISQDELTAIERDVMEHQFREYEQTYNARGCQHRFR